MKAKVRLRDFVHCLFIYLFYLCTYSPDFQESDGGADT